MASLAGYGRQCRRWLLRDSGLNFGGVLWGYSSPPSLRAMLFILAQSVWLSLRGVTFFNALGTSIRVKNFAFRLQCADTYECTYV